MENLLSDPHRFFAGARKERAGAAWAYLAYWALLPSLLAVVSQGFLGISPGGTFFLPTWLSDVVLARTGMSGLALALANGVGVYVGIFISAFVVAIAAHVVAMLMKGKGGFDNALKTVVYGGSVYYAFSWLPVFAPFFALYSTVAQIAGFKELYGLRPGHAILTAIGTLILLGIVAGVVPFLNGVFAAMLNPAAGYGGVQGIVTLLLG
jgi:hypothetical protein